MSIDADKRIDEVVRICGRFLLSPFVLLKWEIQSLIETEYKNEGGRSLKKGEKM